MIKAFTIDVRAELEDEAAALLWELGTLGVEVKPAAGERVRLLAYFDRHDADAVLDPSLRALGARAEPAPVPDVDWVARFRDGFRAFSAGGFLIVPAWDVPAAPPAGSRMLVVDPGRAFGTGTHETTRLCLRALAQQAQAAAPRRVLDLGAGSGLLAVAAARLGCPAVTAVDIDPEAVASARRHALLNGVAVRVLRGDGGLPFRAAAFDLVLANLTAPFHRERAAEIAALVPRGGRLVLSGILTAEANAVAAAYARFASLTRTADGEWSALLATRT